MPGDLEKPARVAFSLAGYAGAVDAFAFVGVHWHTFYPSLGLHPVLLSTNLEALRGDLVSARAGETRLSCGAGGEAGAVGVAVHL